MSKNKIIGFGLALVLFVLLFQPAFIDASVDKPMTHLFAFLGLLVGMVVSGILTNQGEKESGH